MKAAALLKKFERPPEGYGEVPFFWWHGDRITEEKLLWILEQFKDVPVEAFQINYAHSDTGGKSYGLTLASDPAISSRKWWKMMDFFRRKCAERGAAVSLSDYTLGSPGQGFFVDEVLKKHPEFTGRHLVWKNGRVEVETVPDSLDPMYPGVGEAVAETFYGAFERHFPGECGKSVNYFFSDELNFNIREFLWNDFFAAEFLRVKKYDITEKLEALFHDIGPETEKIRLDYHDVAVRMAEKGYFKAIYDWHNNRKMTFGCDHGGRGQDVTEFGDYFRTMKWNTAPGNDQPHLESNIIKNKVNSSIAHLYRRKRVWLEGFYSSNWGTSAAQVADAIFRNFAMGHNLLSLHGLYYSTGGGYWEWAPPCNHFHQPYWNEMPHLLKMSERLSFLLSRGVHVCDGAVIYPVADVEADAGHGKMAVERAFAAGRKLYENGIDFDFMDFESLERAVIRKEEGNTLLCVSGEKYRFIVLPGMRAVRWGMFKKLCRFAAAGGLVLVMDEYPAASDRAGRDDALLNKMVDELRGMSVLFQGSDAPGKIVNYLRSTLTPDFQADAEKPFILHRRIGKNQLYMVYQVPEGCRCFFRVENFSRLLVLDPWSGRAAELPEKYWKRVPGGVECKFPLEKTEAGLFLFAGNENFNSGALEDFFRLFPPENRGGKGERTICFTGEWESRIIPVLDNRYGDFSLPGGGMVVPEVRGAKCLMADNIEEALAAEVEKKGGYVYFGFAPQYFSAPDSIMPEYAASAMTAPAAGFERRDFSWRYGVFDDAGPQGSYHGLKGKISDDFITLGEKHITMCGSSSEYTGEGGYYVFSFIRSDCDEMVPWRSGKLTPRKIYLNSVPVTGNELPLKKGLNRILLCYSSAGRTFFVAERKNDFVQKTPLAMSFYRNEAVIGFDALPDKVGKLAVFEFLSPPGMEKMILPSGGGEVVAAYCDGAAMKLEKQAFIPMEKSLRPAKIRLVIRQKPGAYLGGALTGAIRFELGDGLLSAGDWSRIDGLRFYSGGISCRKRFRREKGEKNLLLELNLLNTSAEVKIDGKRAGFLISPPCRMNLADFVPENSEFELEIIFHNTLANHLITVPTCFRGETSYGCIG